MQKPIMTLPPAASLPMHAVHPGWPAEVQPQEADK